MGLCSLESFLAQDGVIYTGALSPVRDRFGLPSLQQMIRDASK